MIVPVVKSRRKRIIVDVDTQKHFFSSGGIALVRKHQEVLDNIRRTMDWAQMKNVHIVSTVQIYTGGFPCYNCFPPDAEGQKKVSYTLLERHTSFPADDCTDLLPEILERYDQVIFRKRCFDPFEEPKADRMLSELRADEFILVGAVTEGAVRATALGLLARQKNVTIVVDAIGSYDKRVGEIAVRNMWVRGAKLIDTRALVDFSCQPLAAAHEIDY